MQLGAFSVSLTFKYLAMSKVFLVIMFLILISIPACAKKVEYAKISAAFSAEDIKHIEQINRDYTSGWLASDTTKILGLYSDSASIIPSGMQPIEGKEAITAFWFPDDGSTTTVHNYKLYILELKGSGTFAYTYEHGLLTFSYQKEGFELNRTQESYAMTIYRKDVSETWHVIKRIWSDVKQ